MYFLFHIFKRFQPFSAQKWSRSACSFLNNPWYFSVTFPTVEFDLFIVKFFLEWESDLDHNGWCILFNEVAKNSESTSNRICNQDDVDGAKYRPALCWSGRNVDWSCCFLCRQIIPLFDKNSQQGSVPKNEKVLSDCFLTNGNKCEI